MLEAATGHSLDTYLSETLFGPLGMHDTTYERSLDQIDRSGPVHVRVDGHWIPGHIDYYLPGAWPPAFYPVAVGFTAHLSTLPGYSSYCSEAGVSEASG